MATARSRHQYAAYVRYPEKLAVYALRFGRSVRILKNWIVLGKSANPPELPPLNRPEQLPDWFVRHMKTPCPPDLLAAAQVAIKDFSGKVPPPEKSLTISDRRLAAVPQMTSPSGDHLERLRGHVEAAEARLISAQQSGSVADLAQAERAYGAFYDLYRKARETEGTLSKTFGDLVSKQEASVELSALIEDWRAVRQDLPMRIEAAIESGLSLRESVAKASAEEEAIILQRSAAQ